ncbi:hypothetical protein CspHIS471_0606310 [Cutaneotrichosporon sp. HIS471]|nr:hypothetical protein CspHIS471_0606310 [Cutaneotrichosporon sp. HIS471]
MAALSHWASADSAGFRRQSRAGSFLGPPRLFTSAYYPAIQQTVVVDGALPGTESKDEVKVRKRETIFGPDVGDDDQPGWTEGGDGKAVSVDVVKRWVDKAKGEEGLHTTTTLQALVNLKRPSLLLHPLDHVPEADVTSAPVPPAQPLHLLKFNYDAMTPLVKITLSLYPTPNNKSDEVVSHQPPKVLYTGMHPGGFNKLFDLPKEAALDLNLAIVPIPPVEEVIEEEDESRAAAPPASVTTSRTSGERAEPSGQPDPTTIPEHHQEQQHTGRRFGLFRRQREHDVEANIEMTPTNEPPAEETKKEDKKEEDEHGMRLVISLEAIGPEGEPLRRRNAQLTHILVSGTWVPDAGSTAHSGTGKRVWVVKVVRREAQIGAHSFLLKEIYGLSSAAGADSTYPPTSSDPYASTPNECIVCLTSPRDVVLLPCRHLVVCRECAVGMVEFGAGGRVARRDDDAAAATVGGATTGTTDEPPQMGIGIGGLLTPAPAPAPAPRRKKKAKGWYCPVCRQPYTSLLRLALPPSKENGTATPGAIEPVQRAGSIRSMRTTRSTRSVATLPRGAEEMLSGLGPEISDDEDDDRERIEARERAEEQERPQFVIAEATTNPPPRTATPSQQAGPTLNTLPASPPARTTTAGPPVSSIPAAPAPSATADPCAPPADAVAALRVE